MDGLSKLEDYMKQSYPMCWMHVKDYDTIQRKIAELCLKYKYRVVSISFEPETRLNKIVFEKLGGVKNGN